MTTTVDPDVIRSLDPRRSYLPKPHPARTADVETGDPLTEHIRAPVASSLASLSIDDLRREIERRQKAAGQLQARRELLVAELTDIEAQLKAMGAWHHASARAEESLKPSRMARGLRKPRATNAVSLADALAMAVEPRAVVSPTEATELVTANGYVSTAKKLAMAVANTLANDARFKRIGRGQYERVISPIQEMIMRCVK